MGLLFKEIGCERGQEIRPGHAGVAGSLSSYLGASGAVNSCAGTGCSGPDRWTIKCDLPGFGQAGSHGNDTIPPPALRRPQTQNRRSQSNNIVGKKIQKSQHRRHTVVNTPGDRQLSTAAWLPRRRPVLRIISSRRSMRVRVVSYNPKYVQKKNFFLHLNFPDHNQTLYKIPLLLRTRVSIQSRSIPILPEPT